MSVMTIRDAIAERRKYSSLILVCLAIAIYITYWSWISLYRLYTFQAGVFDLGSMSQEFWLVYHQPFFTINTLSGFLNRDVMYIFSPLTFFNSDQLILIIQTIFLGVPAIFVYFIATMVLNKKFTAAVLSIAPTNSIILFAKFSVSYGSTNAPTLYSFTKKDAPATMKKIVESK